VCVSVLKAWPEDALEMVANKFLEDVDMEDDVRSQTIVMCKHFHESVRLMSQNYYETLRRHNYVTPTSYLELILTFKNLLAHKRDEILMLKNRYLTGLEKLQFAASQVYFKPISLLCFITAPTTNLFNSSYSNTAVINNNYSSSNNKPVLWHVMMVLD